MTTHNLVVDLDFVCTDPARNTDEAFDAFSDAVMDALCDLENVDSGVIDPDITANITERHMAVMMGVEADTLRDAIRLFSANVRTALHVAGCSTPDWPDFRPAAGKLPNAREVDFAGA